MSEIRTDPEIANLCRALTAEEKAQLEENVKKDGCTDPLKLWGDILLDGHNRHEICTRLGIPFKTEVIEIKDRGDAINWVIANQLGRRNLIPEDVAYLRGKRYEAEKISLSVAGHRSGRWGNKNDPGENHQGENHQRGLTGQRLAKEFGVSDFTVRKDATFAVAVDKIGEKLGKDVANIIRTGKSDLPKSAVVAFAKDEDMTLPKFNDLRFEHQQRRAKQTKKRKKSAPKAPPLTTFKKHANALDTTAIERMRPFMNAVIQIATSPVTPKTLAADRWPDSWRTQILESLPLAREYLDAFAKAFSSTDPQAEPSHGNDQAEIGEQQVP